MRVVAVNQLESAESAHGFNRSEESVRAEEAEWKRKRSVRETPLKVKHDGALLSVDSLKWWASTQAQKEQDNGLKGSREGEKFVNVS